MLLSTSRPSSRGVSAGSFKSNGLTPRSLRKANDADDQESPQKTAEELGLTQQELDEQVRLSQEIIEEILLEESAGV
jgi:hypothetical protein